MPILTAERMVLSSRARVRSLFLKAASITALVVLALILAGAARFLIWAAAGGRHVSFAWTSDVLPPLSPREQAIAEKHRTRDSSVLEHRKDCNCSLTFWKVTADPGFDSRIVNFLAGFNGCSHVSMDCCLSDASGSWMIESGLGENKKGIVLDGPQYKAVAAWQGRTRARVPIGGLIDCERLHQDLARRVEDPTVRQKGLGDWADFAIGRTRPDRLTCSGLIGQAILLQPQSALAAGLRQAMKERITYGEITPSDLARAVAIEEAGRPGAQIRLTPVIEALWNAIR